MTIVGKHEIYRWESLIGPFVVHKILGPHPPLPRSHTPPDVPSVATSPPPPLVQVCSVLVVICLVTPWFIVALVPIVAFYAHSQRYYITTSRELKRLDSISRSPLHELFAETLHGLTTIRAFRAEERFVNRNKALLDRNQRAYFLSFSGNCWLAMRLELAGTLIVTCAALFAVLEHGRHANFASIAGLSISFALSVTQV